MSALFAIASVLCLAAFALTWVLCVRLKNYGFVDAAFSYGVALLAPLYAFNGPGNLTRKICFSVVGVAWSLRLGTYLLLRIMRHHPSEDVRYEALRSIWNRPWKFLLFFEMQAVLVLIFSLPFLFAAFNQEAKLNVLEVAGLAVAALALCGEATADLQMQRFKRNPCHKGRVCQIGLWNYSRHPNYFFEFMLWCGFAIAALPSPNGWVCVSCPLLMLYFLLRVTGIPLTEEYAVKSKGEAYREYQRTTSAFVPWFKKTPPRATLGTSSNS
jgi:steroid 5-alpha reductase family enzyme